MQNGLNADLCWKDVHCIRSYIFNKKNTPFFTALLVEQISTATSRARDPGAVMFRTHSHYTSFPALVILLPALLNIRITK